MIRQGRVKPENFVCPQTRDEPDPLTIAADDSTRARLGNTSDFLERRNLSYSTVNMYYPAPEKRWSTRGMSGRSVFMADNNANDFRGVPARHTLVAGAAEADVRRAENSPNHAHEGQNFGFGNGHVQYDKTPFIGRGEDNVYAVIRNCANTAPSVSSIPGNEQDVVLIPLSGNGGGDGSLSGKRMDVTLRSDYAAMSVMHDGSRFGYRSPRGDDCDHRRPHVAPQ